MKNLTRIITGAILIACGVIYILGAFGIADINISLDGWWTLFIIIPCLSGLFTSKDKFGNFIGLAVGVLLLLAAQNVFEYDMENTCSVHYNYAWNKVNCKTDIVKNKCR